jgi:hypothetical protein
MSAQRQPPATPRPAVEADHEDFSQQLNIFIHSPQLGSLSHSKGPITQLYNPDTGELPF